MVPVERRRDLFWFILQAGHCSFQTSEFLCQMDLFLPLAPGLTLVSDGLGFTTTTNITFFWLLQVFIKYSTDDGH